MISSGGTEPFVIAQISDLHCGGPYFLPNLLERAITEVNDLDPQIVVVSGDLTTYGFKEEYAQAKEYLAGIDCQAVVVIPGNHDSRNVGYVHFEELFGDRNSVLRVGAVTVVAVDSTEPDLDNGQIGRGRYRWIDEQFAVPADLRVFVLHHHLLPVPGTGREREPAAWVEDRLVGEVDGDLGAARPLLDERQPVVRHAAQLLAPAHESHGDELVRQLVEGVANHVGIVLAVDDRQGSHRVVVTSSSMRAVYFSYVFVSVENWMIFSWPWNGYLRHTSTCVPSTSTRL